ncbi:MAG TPA: ABC transporter ATP-binding protein [Ilumatobacteraceae bacterium]|nr:ABC transporter ATP-binding protein [Ilumatobacteraceae bacterium]
MTEVSAEQSEPTATDASGHPVGRPALAFVNLSKTFADGTAALSNISFEVRDGEFVTVVGPSGCGKSTLLKIASKLIPETSGQVNVPSEGLGYVFQDATLLPWRTVQKNVELFLELHGVDKARRKVVAAEAIELVGLKGFERHHPKRLSGGMKMRVSLARSLTLKPNVFLFDEPFGALDEITRERLNDELIKLFVKERFAALFITHSVYEAVFLSTRVLVMSARPGRLIAEFEIPFGYPRPSELRFDGEFARLCGEVSHALRDAHA